MNVLVVAERAVDDEQCARLAVLVLRVPVRDEAGRGGGHAESGRRRLDRRLVLLGVLPEERKDGGAVHERCSLLRAWPVRFVSARAAPGLGVGPGPQRFPVSRWGAAWSWRSRRRGR